jgi:hypothetical protein
MPPRTTMGQRITTKQLFLRQDARSSHTRNQASEDRGLLTVNMDIHLVLPCIITHVKMYTSRQRPETSPWILTDRFLMTAKDMMDAFQNTHTADPFANVGDDTVKSLTALAAIFKLKLQQAPSLVTQASPVTIIQRPSLIPFPTLISTSPMPYRRQTRSQTTIHTPDTPNRPLPPRVVTNRTLRHSPPRVPTGSLELTPRNLSQYDFCGMDTAHMAIA